jgi:hypothetical protein
MPTAFRKSVRQQYRFARALGDRLLFTVTTHERIVDFSAEKLTCRKEVNASNIINIMGDRSPKSNQKKSNQKQSKASSAEQSKQKAIAAKQSVNKK